MKQLTFKKEKSGRWYIDLPGYPGPKSALEMVEGADTFLDLLSNKGKRVILAATITKTEGYKILRKVESTPLKGGAIYTSIESGHMWLCDVTRHVFSGRLPKFIYYKLIS